MIMNYYEYPRFREHFQTEPSRAPAPIQTLAMTLLRSAPLAAFFQVVEQPESASLAGRLREIFTPAALQMASV